MSSAVVQMERAKMKSNWHASQRCLRQGWSPEWNLMKFLHTNPLLSTPAPLPPGFSRRQDRRGGAGHLAGEGVGGEEAPEDPDVDLEEGHVTRPLELVQVGPHPTHSPRELRHVPAPGAPCTGCHSKRRSGNRGTPNRPSPFHTLKRARRDAGIEGGAD